MLRTALLEILVKYFQWFRGVSPVLYHHTRRGEFVHGPHNGLVHPSPRLYGDCSHIWGNAMGLHGCTTGCQGNLNTIPLHLRQLIPDIRCWRLAPPNAP